MRRPTVDYSGFRLRKIGEPQYRHLLLLLGWVGYFLLYLLTENLIPPESCHVMHSRLDDLIPFCEFFLIPYVFWYLLVAGSLLYFALYDVKSFKNLSIYIIITQVVAMTIYILYPSRQDLRPDVFPRENIFTHILAMIYAFDTNTGVCPSLHVAYSLGILSVWLKYKYSSPLWKAFIIVAVVLICLSTAFIKQHSVIDIFAALLLGLLAEAIVFGRQWMARLRHFSIK